MIAQEHFWGDKTINFTIQTNLNLPYLSLREKRSISCQSPKQKQSKCEFANLNLLLA